MHKSNAKGNVTIPRLKLVALVGFFLVASLASCDKKEVAPVTASPHVVQVVPAEIKVIEEFPMEIRSIGDDGTVSIGVVGMKGANSHGPLNLPFRLKGIGKVGDRAHVIYLGEYRLYSNGEVRKFATQAQVISESGEYWEGHFSGNSDESKPGT